jgi:lipoprotein signal peptidase
MTETTGHERPAPDQPMAGGDLRSHLRLWVVAAVALTLDLGSKHYVFAHLGPHETWKIIPSVIEFQRSLNDGAVFGAFNGMTMLFMLASLLALAFVFYLFRHSGARHWGLHVALGLVLAGALGNLYDRAFVKADVLEVEHQGSSRSVIGSLLDGPEDGWLRIGAWPDGSEPQEWPADMVIDVRRQGVVRDFIKFVPRFPAWVPKLGGRDVWPWVFNVADSSLVCGVILLILCSSRHTRQLRQAEAAAAAQPDGSQVEGATEVEAQMDSSRQQAAEAEEHPTN